MHRFFGLQKHNVTRVMTKSVRLIKRMCDVPSVFNADNTYGMSQVLRFVVSHGHACIPSVSYFKSSSLMNG